MLPDGPSELNWIPLLLRILLRSHGFLLEVVGAELLSAEVVVAEPGPGYELDYETDFQGL